ncbi:MAG: hypothetical protein JSS86_05135 [Cyanobacteria bacterium SZAS LIN-2]|nr:hypothetical protein [Cyanobacteria bacterium SZAS LIN-2]
MNFFPAAQTLTDSLAPIADNFRTAAMMAAHRPGIEKASADLLIDIGFASVEPVKLSDLAPQVLSPGLLRTVKN